MRDAARSARAKRSGATGRRSEWLAILWLSAKGYRLHTISTTSSGSKGIIAGGDRIQATLVFEKLG